MRHGEGLLLSLLLCCPASSPATVQEAAAGADEFFDQSPLILTASRMSQPILESPASVSVIDRQMIEASGARQIAAARRLDMRYAYGLTNGLKIELVGQNLLDEYEDYEPENLRDRVVFLRLSGSF